MTNSQEITYLRGFYATVFSRCKAIIFPLSQQMQTEQSVIILWQLFFM